MVKFNENYRDELLKQKFAEMKAQGAFEVKWNPSDLVYQFDFLDGVQIQQMIIALQQGYKVDSVVSANGVIEFVLKKGCSNV